MCKPLGNAVQVQFEGSYRCCLVDYCSQLKGTRHIRIYKKSEVIAIKIG